MREAIGGSQLLLIIITIFIVVMMLLAGSIGYTKAFKARNGILNIVQSHGAYGENAETVMTKNDGEAEKEILSLLNNMGYNVTIGRSNGCKKLSELKNNSSLKEVNCWKSSDYNFSIYSMMDTENNWRYGVETYMYFELPLFGKNDIFSFPLYADSYTFLRTENGSGNKGNGDNDYSDNDVIFDKNPYDGVITNREDKYTLEKHKFDNPIIDLAGRSTETTITGTIIVDHSYKISKYQLSINPGNVSLGKHSGIFSNLDEGTNYNICGTVEYSGKTQEVCKDIETKSPTCHWEEECHDCINLQKTCRRSYLCKYSSGKVLVRDEKLELKQCY